MPRRTPIRHSVRQHRREGNMVHKYERGEGEAPKQVIGSQSTYRGGTYRVNINYLDAEAFTPTGEKYPASHGARTEHLTIRAGSYLEAMDQGLNRIGNGTPISVMMRRI